MKLYLGCDSNCGRKKVGRNDDESDLILLFLTENIVNGDVDIEGDKRKRRKKEVKKR